MHTSILPQPYQSTQYYIEPQHTIPIDTQSSIDYAAKKDITTQPDELLDLDSLVLQYNALYYSKIDKEWKLNLPDSLMKKLKSATISQDVYNVLMHRPEFQKDLDNYIMDIYMNAQKYDRWK